MRLTKTSAVVSNDTMMGAQTFGRMLRDVGERAGYEDPMRPYHFRRMHGNMLDRKSFSYLLTCGADWLAEKVSAVRRSKNFGH